MSNRLFFTLVGSAALMVGGGFYLLLRETSRLANMLGAWPMLQALRQVLAVPCLRWLSFYLPDYLWGLALCSGLLVIWNPKGKTGVCCVAATVLCGGCWEVLQLLGLVGGTGDGWDVVMYLLAGLSAQLLLWKRRGNQ